MLVQMSVQFFFITLDGTVTVLSVEYMPILEKK